MAASRGEATKALVAAIGGKAAVAAEIDGFDRRRGEKKRKKNWV